MKMNVKKLIQQVMEELKNKRTQKIMIWSLGAAVCFLILIGIFSSISGNGSKNDGSKNSEEQTSTQTQNGEQNIPTISQGEVFYVDFSQGIENIHLVTLSGTIEDETVEVHVMYDKEDEDVFMYYYFGDLQLTEMLLSYAVELEEGVAYEVSVQEKNGVICLEQNNEILCLVSLTPNATCQWTSIIPDCKEYAGNVIGTDFSEESSSETESNTAEESTAEESTAEESSSEANTPEENNAGESSSAPVSADVEKINYKALFRDIVISAILALVLAGVAILVIIATTRKANPLKVIVATIHDMYPNLQEHRSLKRRRKEEDDDFEDDDFEDDEYEDDEYEDDDSEDDAYEDDDSEEDDYE